MTFLSVPNFVIAAFAEMFASLSTVFFLPVFLFAVVLIVLGVIKLVFSR